MNWDWYQLRRLRGAFVLILLGIVFLLHEFIHRDMFPLFFIGLGVILLAERLLPLPPPPPPGQGYPPYPPQYPYGYQPPVQPPVNPAPPSTTGNASDWRSQG